MYIRTVICFIFTILAIAYQGISFAESEHALPNKENHRHIRPQEPIRPYPYLEEEVSFVNKNDGVVLSGTLTIPHSEGPFPVVVLLHGSAPLDRDEILFDHKIFLVLSDYLTRQGIAVLRFDKRGAGKSAGNYSLATVEDFANDACAAVDYLKTRHEINPKQIGLIGHSEGGMTASLAASKSNDVAFLVFMAAPAVNFEEIMYTQARVLLQADGVAQKDSEIFRPLLSGIFTILKQQKNREDAARELRLFLIKYLGELTPSQKKTVEAYYGGIEQQIAFFNSTWFRYALTYDPTQVLKKIKIPVLVLHGEKDLLVDRRRNLALISLALEKAQNPDYTICELPKVNHWFQTCQTGSDKECTQIEETLSPVALTTMSHWILQKTAK